MPNTTPPGPVCCAYCEAQPAVVSHLWLSDAWDKAPLCAVCHTYVLAEPHMPRLVDDDEEEETPCSSKS